MFALCTHCKNPVEARYVIGEESVELRRMCPEHGQTSTIVSGDPSLFAEAFEYLRLGRTPRRGLIVELLDGCNMRCRTCIAASSPDLSAQRRPHVIARQIARLSDSDQPIAILLSGGEPTIHPELDQFLELAEAVDVSRRVLITNGVRLATDPMLIERLRSAPKPWEVFLQFDSLRSEVLRDMRSEDNLLRVRRAALDALNEAAVSATLVCVIKRGHNLDELATLLDFAISEGCVAGLQLQPVRNAGRLENYEESLHGCNASDVVRELSQMEQPPLISPHPASPLSVLIGRYSRTARAWLEATEVDTVADEFFLEPTRQPDDSFRLSVVEYSDSGNWSSLRSEYSPLNVMQRNGQVVPVDDHFLPEVNSRRMGAVDLLAS